MLAMIANRRRPGTTSRKSSSRLAAVSVDWIDRGLNQFVDGEQQ